MLDRFKGQFQTLTVMGAKYHNQQRFWGLSGDGKPLWEFKEHDHRLYCARLVMEERIIAVLFSGWIKDKKGKTEREKREVSRAITLYNEFVAEFKGGSYDVLAALDN